MNHRLEFQSMGCRMLAVVDCLEGESPPDLVQVPAWFEDWEQCLSRFRIDSELSQVNTRAGSTVQVSNVLWDVFQAAREAEKMTHGLVTPLMLNALIHAGYDRSFESLLNSGPYFVPDDSQVIESLAELEWDADSHSISLPAGAQLDFGGVAKGWAASQAVERLRIEGPALVDAGGDIALSGLRRNGDSWQIGVSNPFNPNVNLEILYLEGGGVATSGKDYRRWMRGDVLQHHIIDPRSGMPAKTDILTATIIAPTVLLAEAFAKAVLISGSQAGMTLLEGQPDLAGLLVLENGELIYSRNLQEYL